MPDPCTALKFAHDEKSALSLLCTGSEKKGFRLTRSGVSVNIIEIKEIQ